MTTSRSEEGEGSRSKQQNLDELIEAARIKERQERLQALAEGRRQRSTKFKSVKDYNRKDKTWRKEND